MGSFNQDDEYVPIAMNWEVLTSFDADDVYHLNWDDADRPNSDKLEVLPTYVYQFSI